MKGSGKRAGSGSERKWGLVGLTVRITAFSDRRGSYKIASNRIIAYKDHPGCWAEKRMKANGGNSSLDQGGISGHGRISHIF